MGIIADVAALARAGYTMADIRELMQTKEPEAEAPKENTNSSEFPEQSKESVETHVVSQPVDSQIETTDYKAKYEELLAKTQADNRKENFGGGPDTRTDEQKAIDILASIF